MKHIIIANLYYLQVYLSVCNSLNAIIPSSVKGVVAHGDYFFPKKFEFVSLCSFICLQAVYQLSGARLLGMAALRILLLTFISRFVIDFLSIRKVIIFSAIATDDRHPLRSRSIHQNAANCMTIRFRYIEQPRGGTENLLRTLT